MHLQVAKAFTSSTIVANSSLVIPSGNPVTRSQCSAQIEWPTGVKAKNSTPRVFKSIGSGTHLIGIPSCFTSIKALKSQN